MEEEDGKPTPDNFDAYLPWACKQLELSSTVIVDRVYDEFGGSPSKTNKLLKRSVYSKVDINSKRGKVLKNENSVDLVNIAQYAKEKTINILTIYDQNDNLIQLKILDNKVISRMVFKVIALIVQFHGYLNKITINCGLDKPAMYELNKLLPISNITDVCLDFTRVPDGYYDVLLDNQTNLRQFSLAKCYINDHIVKNIAAKLMPPLPASTTLSILNLSSNKITDTGAKYISEVLRVNRQLAYLNLSNNTITDKGAIVMFDMLLEFPISIEESLSAKAKYMSYLKQRKEFIAEKLAEFKSDDVDIKSQRRKSIRASANSSIKKGKIEIEGSLKSISDVGGKSLLNLDALWLERAENLAQSVIGNFKGAFSSVDTISRDGAVFCYGNNTLSYLNLSYNDLSYIAVKKLLEVLIHQTTLNRVPRGLVNMCIEGNCFPTTCEELNQIDEILELGLRSYARKPFAKKKFGR